MLEAVRAFNPYDLYSKSDELPDAEKLKVRSYWRSNTFNLYFTNDIRTSPTTWSSLMSTSQQRFYGGNLPVLAFQYVCS
jgi:hypothetical protein